MATYFWDSSALLKRYVTERGTAWVNGLTAAAAGNAVRLASFTAVELISAVTRRKRGGTVSAADARLMIGAVRYDFANYFLVLEISPNLMGRAMDLAEHHALRGADSLQLAAAIQVHLECIAVGDPMTLVSADAELNAAALAEGLTVVDPNTHP